MIVNQLDIKDILQKYKGGGCSAYHPRTMIKIIFYSYLSNIYSCRKMALAVKENLPLKDSLQKLFAEIVKLLVKEGYLSLDIQYIDGTKIESAANKYTFVWRGSVEKYKERLEAKINKVLSDIEDSIQSDNQEINKKSFLKKLM